MVTIGLVAGDPSGVGPEVTAKLIAAKRGATDMRIVLFGSDRNLRDGFRIAGVEFDIPVVDDAASACGTQVALVESGDAGGYRPGEASAAGGAVALDALTSAARAARSGQVDAIVYGPLNKQAMWLAGHKAIDELHFFREQLGVSGFCCELNNQGSLWTSRVTSHIPFRHVADGITIETIAAAAKAGAAAVEAVQSKRPKIAIAGLNPHLGEGGALGCEEIEVIQPAIERLRAEGYDIAGLYPADTVFLRIEREKIDLVVTMFHDQGQIALKALGFGNTSTVLGGLPLPVVTASQGTAYDIAGTNRADPSGLISAFDLAGRLAISASLAP
jgi:4-hydroxythreonine-4-phosphate dehydrogenase